MGVQHLTCLAVVCSKKAKRKDEEANALSQAAEALGEDLSASLLSSTLDFGLTQEDVPNPRWYVPPLTGLCIKLLLWQQFAHVGCC